MRYDHIRITPAIATLLLIAPAAGAPQAPLVTSPATPAHEPVSIQLEELWRLDADDDFGLIYAVEVDEDGNSYLLDYSYARVMVVTPDGEVSRLIGRRGEGPGELLDPTQLYWTPDGDLAVLQTVPTKIEAFAPDGTYRGLVKLPMRREFRYRYVQRTRAEHGHTVMHVHTQRVVDERLEQTHDLVAVNPDGTRAAVYTSATRAVALAGGVMREREWSSFDSRWALDADGTVYAVESLMPYRVHVYHADGRPAHVIEREFETRGRNDFERAYVGSYYEAMTAGLPGVSSEIEADAPAIVEMFTPRPGELWVRHCRSQEGLTPEAFGRFDVFDRDGRFDHVVTLFGEGDPERDFLAMRGDRLYVAVEYASIIDAELQAAGSTTDVPESEGDGELAFICYRVQAINDTPDP